MMFLRMSLVMLKILWKQRTSLDRPVGAKTSSKDTSEDSSVGDALEEKIVCKDNAMPPILLPTIRNASSH